MDDAQIVAEFLARNETAIDMTQQKYGSRLRGLAFQIAADRCTAEECENDTYWQAWRAIPPHEPRSYLFAFLARITRHLALNCCRSRSSLKRSAFVCEFTREMEECIPAPDDVACRLDDAAFAEVLNRFLAGLDGRRRGVFLRRYCFLDSVAQIARRYGMSEGAVKTQLFRTRKQLRDFLEREGYEL